MSHSMRPMDCSMPGSPVQHQLPELAQTHVHQVSDAIQPFHPLSSPSSPAFNLSQHQGLFQWVSSLHQVASASASVLPMNIQDWFPLGLTGLISLQSKGLTRVFSNTIAKCWPSVIPRIPIKDCPQGLILPPSSRDSGWPLTLIQWPGAGGLGGQSVGPQGSGLPLPN